MANGITVDGIIDTVLGFVQGIINTFQQDPVNTTMLGIFIVVLFILLGVIYSKDKINQNTQKKLDEAKEEIKSLKIELHKIKQQKLKDKKQSLKDDLKEFIITSKDLHAKKEYDGDIGILDEDMIVDLKRRK